MSDNIFPLGDLIVVRKNIVADRTKGGIYIPEPAKDKPGEGVVVAVGSGRLLVDGNRSKPQVEVGDRVMYNKYSGNEIKVNEEELLLLREEELFAILKNNDQI